MGELRRKEEANRQLKQLLAEERAKSALYERLTKIIVAPAEAVDPESLAYEGMYECEVFSGKLKFELGFFEDRVEYSPLLTDESIKSTLPEFLSTDIEFQQKEAPLFLKNMISAIRP